MTEASTRLDGRKPAWAAPGSCSGSPGDPLGLGPTRYADDNPDDLEAAALLRAFTAGNASLRQSQVPVSAAGAELVSRYHAAKEAIDDLNRFRSVGSVREACEENCRVVRRHTTDGPEDRRRRAMRPRLLWLVLAISAVFDAAFIGSVMQQIFDVGTDEFLYYLAYLPGVGIAVCLYAAGVQLAVHVFRRRDRLGRRLEVPKLNPREVLRRALWDWRPEPLRRRKDDLPWSRLAGPVLFTALVFGLLSLAALVRAQTAVEEFENLRPYLPVFVALIILLSIGAIAMKVQSYNPYADSSEQARDKVQAAETSAADLVHRARQAAGEHVKAWDAVHAAIGGAEARAREVVEEACAVMLEGRARRTPRADVKIALPLVWLRWPSQNGGGAPPETELPGLDRTILTHAIEAVALHDPAKLDGDLQAAVDRLNNQFEVDCADLESGSSASTIPVQPSRPSAEHLDDGSAGESASPHAS